jgi:choline-sulfatase
MRLLIPFGLTMTCVLSQCGAAGDGDRPQGGASASPNVVLINMDDLNDWIGPLGGHPQVQTPHLDRLAARGVVFTNAHCQAPLCNPSRASVFTGVRPETSGLYALNPGFRQAPALRSVLTLPQLFAQAGYHTATTGKNYHDVLRQDPELPAEWGEWGFLGSFAPRPPEPLIRKRLNPHPFVDWGVFPERDEDQDDWQVAQWAVDRLRKADVEPLFLAVGFRHPHLPMYASQRWFDLYPERVELPISPPHDPDDLPSFARYLNWRLPEPQLAVLQRENEWHSHVRAYLASVSFADHLLGQVLDALEASPAAGHTYVVFWSDHGYHNGEKGITGKNTLWEIGTKVPLIVAGPGLPQGARVDVPVELLDVYATLAELCGLPVPAHVEGLSLVPWLRNPQHPKERPALTVHGPGNVAVRSAEARYIRYADGSEEFYDHTRDRHELRNLAGDAEYAAAIAAHRRWVPEFAAPVEGSRVRLIDYRDGIPYWEGQPIEPGTPFAYDPYDR